MRQASSQAEQNCGEVNQESTEFFFDLECPKPSHQQEKRRARRELNASQTSVSSKTATASVLKSRCNIHGEGRGSSAQA
jgi:hypothetical protein